MRWQHCERLSLIQAHASNDQRKIENTDHSSSAAIAKRAISNACENLCPESGFEFPERRCFPTEQPTSSTGLSILPPHEQICLDCWPNTTTGTRLREVRAKPHGGLIIRRSGIWPVSKTGWEVKCPSANDTVICSRNTHNLTANPSVVDRSTKPNSRQKTTRAGDGKRTISKDITLIDRWVTAGWRVKQSKS